MTSRQASGGCLASGPDIFFSDIALCDAKLTSHFVPQSETGPVTCSLRYSVAMVKLFFVISYFLFAYAVAYAYHSTAG